MRFKCVLFLLLVISILFNMYMINVKAISKNEYKIEEKSDNYKILVYYPKTDFFKLNNIIKNNINNYIKEFKDVIKNTNYPINQYYSLIILYDVYEYKDYLSYIFRIEDYTGGAHPNHRIYTVVYDKNSNNIVTIDDLIKNNSNILKIFSNISRNILIKNSRINSASMLYEGTNAIKSNFENFVFSKDGIILFFPQYQVAPYSQGEFNVIIPYVDVK